MKPHILSLLLSVIPALPTIPVSQKAPYEPKIIKVQTIEPVIYVTSCAQEIKRYGWNQTVAYNVMMQESKGRADNLNDNVRTGDYSVGCFQINLYKSNLQSKYRIAAKLGYTGQPARGEMTEWLWRAENNVAVAWELYKDSKWGPWSFTTCKKVACY